jgi:predicted N-formylglutamate amidohydrolase
VKARPAPAIVLSCEHGGNRVPKEHRALFAGAAALLATHRGWDLGALALAKQLRALLRVPLVATETTRLLADANRSPTHSRVFSEPVRALPRATRDAILARHHAPHRASVEAMVRAAIARRGRAVHVAVHSFTPVLDGVVRAIDVGLLYDPSRPLEREVCARWRAALREKSPELRVRANAPYRGVADGLPTALRKRLARGSYAGIELEVNQRIAVDARARAALGRVLAASLLDAVTSLERP